MSEEMERWGGREGGGGGDGARERASLPCNGRNRGPTNKNDNAENRRVSTLKAAGQL